MEGYNGWPYLVIAKHAADANQAEPFPLLDKYGDHKIRRIGRILRELSRLKEGKPFFISARKCGELVGEPEYFGKLVLDLFVRDGILTFVGCTEDMYRTRQYQFKQ